MSLVPLVPLGLYSLIQSNEKQAHKQSKLQRKPTPLD